MTANIKTKSIVLLVTLLSFACNDFGDLNKNPNNPANPNAAGLMTGAMRRVGEVVTDMIPALYVQQFGDVTYIDESRYKTAIFNYNVYYSTPLSSLQHIIDLNNNEETRNAMAISGSNNNQIATARILKAFYFLWLTDRWGDVPYSEALKGSDNFTPKFDSQEDIYKDLFKELKEAAVQFDGGKAVQGDLLFSGNADRWKKFANSIRLIMALRMSKVNPSLGKQEFAAALADGVLSSNSENVQYKYIAEAANEHPLYTNYITQNRKDYAVSSTFIDFLLSVGDPRLPAMADKNQLGAYRGVPYGVFPSQGRPEDFSLAASSMRQQASAVNVLTYAQVLLAQAEAATLGWIDGDAKSFYNAAIKSSMEQWKVYNETAYLAFTTQPAVSFDAAKAVELIATQRWVALFYQGSEAWAEWRRTGYPKLTPATVPLNGVQEIPRRMAYPVTENALNRTHYAEVLARQGKDDQYTRIWWDKK
ncbi:SusD/RagB family nutrient-binding outer membrane lipoprotein [Dyadobacter jiangsuensis]